MEEVLASEQFRDVPHEGVVKHGEIWDALEPVTSEHNADVIVTGTVAGAACKSSPWAR
jgi:hypothetical protein